MAADVALKGTQSCAGNLTRLSSDISVEPHILSAIYLLAQYACCSDSPQLAVLGYDQL